MPRKTTIIQEEPKDSPDVIAYRVGELEKSVNEGFKTVHQKLDELKDGFVTHEQFEKEVKEAGKLHANHETRIQKLEQKSDRFEGAITLLKVIGSVLTVIGIVIGALWWTRG